VISDTGKPVIIDGGSLTAADIKKMKVSEIVETWEGTCCRSFHSALWQAFDPNGLGPPQ